MPAVIENTGASVAGTQTGSASTAITAISLNLAAGTNTELLVLVTFNASVSAISGTFGAKSLLLVGGPTTGTNCGNTYGYHVSAPATGATNLNLSWTTSSDYDLVVIAFDNVAGGLTYVHNTGSGTSGTVATTSLAADAVFAMGQNIHNLAFTTTGQTGINLLTDSSTSVNMSCSYITSPAANQTMTYPLTGGTDNFVVAGITAVNVVPPAGVSVWLLTH